MNLHQITYINNRSILETWYNSCLILEPEKMTLIYVFHLYHFLSLILDEWMIYTTTKLNYIELLRATSSCKCDHRSAAKHSWKLPGQAASGGERLWRIQHAAVPETLHSFLGLSCTRQVLAVRMPTALPIWPEVSCKIVLCIGRLYSNPLEFETNICGTEWSDFSINKAVKESSSYLIQSLSI